MLEVQKHKRSERGNIGQDGPDEEEKWLTKSLFGYFPSEEEELSGTNYDEITENEMFKIDKIGFQASDLKDVEEDSKYNLTYREAWKDEYDEEIQVSLTDKKRLKKLRTFEEENVLSGIEFQKRLRDQFQKLHHDTNWARLDVSKNKENDKFNEEGNYLIWMNQFIPKFHDPLLFRNISID
jgi:hypothetical protein